MSSSSWLRALLRLPVTYVLPSIISFSAMFHEAVLMQDETNPFSFSSSSFMYNIPLLIDSMLYFLLSHTIDPTVFFHLFAVPHFRIFQVFIFYFPSTPCKIAFQV